MLSIRAKIAAITIAAILISILSVVLACSVTIRAENDRYAVETMNLIGQNTQKSVEEYIMSIEQSVEMAGNIAADTLNGVVLLENGGFGKYGGGAVRTPEQADTLDAYLSAYCANLQEVFASVASHTQGVVTYYYCINPEVSENEHGFFYSRVGKTGFVEQEPLDARELDPNDIEHTTWYYTPIERGRPSWVGPYKAHFLGEMITYSYLIPVYKSGLLIGVLGMDIPFETITSLVSSIRIYDSGFACLLDWDGTVLYHPDMDFGVMLELEDEAIRGDILTQASSGDKLYRYTSNGQARQLSFTTLSNGMKLVIVAPENEISSSWLKLEHIIIVTAVVIIGVFSVLLLFIMGIVTRPLQQLTVASQRLAEEDYDVELDYTKRDEIGSLTKSFAQMRDRLKVYIEDLNRQATTEALTGLPNMRRFFELAEQERSRLLEIGRKPVMLYFNLVGMKYYNSLYGFEEGDRLLLQFADILTRHFGEPCVSHFGQDIFAAVSAADTVEEDLKDIFAEALQANGGRSLPIRAGIYSDDLEVVSAVAACDRAKYACNQLKGFYLSDYRYFTPAMLREARSISYVVTHLDQALAEGWIKVYYQAIVRAANGRVCDEEALSRWIDPERGVISPGEFVPILENSKLIYKLDLYVLEQILQKMLSLREMGIALLPHSLNLSRVDFEVCDIVEEIRRRVDEAGIPRELLNIEVTESTIGSDFEFMKEQILRFQSLGFKVWMDDFGSGYSSLDVLQDIHFDLIKFDMRFMRRFGEGEDNKIILTELFKMAIGLGIDTVAEGVESESQADFLKEVGCTKLQGFYYAEPQSLEQLKANYKNAGQLKYENLREADYYSAIGRISLYDLASITSDNTGEMDDFFDTLPMAVVESDGEQFRIVRSNKSYREFLDRVFSGYRISEQVKNSELENSIGGPFARAVAQSRDQEGRILFEEKLPNGSTIHAMLRHIATNPVTGIDSCVVVILGMGKGSQL